MPSILEAKCNECDYFIGPFSQSATFVTLDDGKEKILPHPCEKMTAGALTGKTISELTKEKRMIYKYGLICQNCGKYDLYPNQNKQPGGHISSIVSSIPPDEAQNMCCIHCQKIGMHSVMGQQIGCLALLLGKKTKPNIFDCPKCNNGTVEIKMIGIS